MKRIAAAALLAVALALAACGTSITSGTVVAKRYTPPHDGMALEPVPRQVCRYVTHGTSGTETCSVQTQYTYVPHHFTATWQVEIEHKGQTAWLTVTQGAYRKAVVGKRFSATEAGT